MEINIVQAYTKINHQTIILVSGHSGTGKCKLAEFLANVFNFLPIHLSHYQYKSYDDPMNYVDIKGKKVLDIDNIYKSINWDEFNLTVNSRKTQGIVVCGFGFPLNLLKFTADFHLHIKINKDTLLKRRSEYIIKNPEKKINTYGEEFEKTILKTLTMTNYYKLIVDSKIDLFIDGNIMNVVEINDTAFNFIIKAVDVFVDGKSLPVVALG